MPIKLEENANALYLQHFTNFNCNVLSVYADIIQNYLFARELFASNENNPIALQISEVLITDANKDYDKRIL